jgi:predicted nucleotidyltransferase component of viral defense system
VDNFINGSPSEQRLYFEQAQAKLGLPPESIEKDFWVCWTLWKLFKLPRWGEHLTFKGGTSLSKAWALIERFSEDIDVVVSRDVLGFGGELSPDKAQSAKQLRKRIQSLKKACQSCIRHELKTSLEQSFMKALPNGAEWSLEMASRDEDPDEQTLLFKYPGTLTSHFSYLSPQVKIELGARSDTWPTESPTIQPYLAKAFPELLVTKEIMVHAVAPERTFWEKAMLLHEETFRPIDKPRKTRLARHYYDLWCLIRRGVAARAMENLALFHGVAGHRAVYFNIKWVDYDTFKKGALCLLPRKDQVSAWKQDYNAMQGEMFFGEMPEFDEILQVVGGFETMFNKE